MRCRSCDLVEIEALEHQGQGAEHRQRKEQQDPRDEWAAIPWDRAIDRRTLHSLFRICFVSACLPSTFSLKPCPRHGDTQIIMSARSSGKKCVDFSRVTGYPSLIPVR